MRRWVRRAGIAAVIVAALLLANAFLSGGRSIAVEVARIERGLVEDVVTNSQAGTVKSRERSMVGAERAGRIAEILRREGTEVKRGDVIARLDTSTEQMQLDLAVRDLEAARAALAAAEARATLAEQEHGRIVQLRQQALVAQDELDRSTSALDAARADRKAAAAGVARAEAAVRLARDEVAHREIRAPFDGVVARRFVEVGESVVPGQSIAEVVALERLYVSAPIDEMDIGRLHEGFPARVTLDPYRDLTWHGRVTRVSPVVDDVKLQNRTLEIEVELEPDPALPVPRPGTSADVEVVIARRDSTLRAPSLAILEGRRVLALERGRAVSHDVEVGLRNWQWTEIRAGVSAGDVVITSLDLQGVRAGARVSARSAPADSAAARRP